MPIVRLLFSPPARALVPLRVNTQLRPDPAVPAAGAYAGRFGDDIGCRPPPVRCSLGGSSRVCFVSLFADVQNGVLLRRIRSPTRPSRVGEMAVFFFLLVTLRWSESRAEGTVLATSIFSHKLDGGSPVLELQFGCSAADGVHRCLLPLAGHGGEEWRKCWLSPDAAGQLVFALQPRASHAVAELAAVYLGQDGGLLSTSNAEACRILRRSSAVRVDQVVRPRSLRTCWLQWFIAGVEHPASSSLITVLHCRNDRQRRRHKPSGSWAPPSAYACADGCRRPSCVGVESIGVALRPSA